MLLALIDDALVRLYQFLRARAMERQLRLSQQADAAHVKGIAALERSTKKRALFTGASGSGQQPEASVPDADTESETPDASARTATMDTHVALLTEFFKDMAAFQPSQKDLADEQAHRAVAEKREGALLEHFAEFFESDTALQNLVDEEMWLSSDAKAARRAKRRSSLHPTATASAQTHASVDNVVSSPLTSEDYYSTAQYIEALMRQVAEHERSESAGVERDRRPLGLDASAASTVDQLAASWKFAQRRSQSRSARSEVSVIRERAKTAMALDEIERQRRSEWMQSPYVQQLGAAELAVQQELNPLRSPLILTRQLFQDQEESMPWQAVWHEPLAAQSGDVDGSDPTRQHRHFRALLDPSAAARDEDASSEAQTHKSPRCVPVRPTTAASGASRSDTSREVTTAAQSAAFAFSHARRIHSASARSKRPSPRVAVHNTRSPRSVPSCAHRHVDTSSQQQHDSVVCDPSEQANALYTDSLQRCDGDDASHWDREEPALATACASAAVADADTTTTAREATQEDTRLASVTTAAEAKPRKTKTAKRRKEKQTNAAKRFARQVQELLVISAAVKESERAAMASVVT